MACAMRSILAWSGSGLPMSRGYGEGTIRSPRWHSLEPNTRECALIICPNCAWRNPAASRFCENCGADLDNLNRTAAQPAPSWPQPTRQDEPATFASTEDPQSPDWRMSPLPEEELRSRGAVGGFGSWSLPCSRVLRSVSSRSAGSSTPTQARAFRLGSRRTS